MKILKYTVGVIVVLLIGFFLFGVIEPEVSYECEVMVEKPLAECWAVSQDESKMAEWLRGFQKVEHVSGTPGTVGAVSDVYFLNDGEEMIIRETITAIVPEESISMNFTSDFMDMDYTFHLSSVDGNTKISSSSFVRGTGMFSRSMVAFMGGTFETQEETNLSLLKKTIEEN